MELIYNFCVNQRAFPFESLTTATSSLLIRALSLHLGLRKVKFAFVTISIVESVIQIKCH